MKSKFFLPLFALFTLFAVAGCSDNDSDSDNKTPGISSATPANNATGVARNKALTVTFSAPMDPATITASTVYLKQGATTVPCAITYSGNTVTLTPNESLAPNTKYTLTVTTGVKDKDGVPLAANSVWTFTTSGTTSVLATVNLRTSANFALLAKAAINVTPSSMITGDIGISPAATSYITGLSISDAIGFATSAQVTGKIYGADMASPTPSNLTTAVSDMETAYNDAAGRPTPDFLELNSGNIGGKTLVRGLYKWSGTVTAPSSFELSGGANDIWIFQIAGDLSVSPAVLMTLTGGAKASNIFWQVAGEVTVGSTAHIEGNILSQTGISLGTGASLNGRGLAQTAIILDKNIVVKP